MSALQPATPETPTWSSIAAQGVVASNKEKNNSKAMTAVCENKQVENTEVEAARNKEIENLKAYDKNIQIPDVMWPGNVKKDTITEKAITVPEKSGGRQDGAHKQEKQGRYNNNDNNGSKSNVRRGRRRNTDNYEDNRTYASRPSAPSTLFDHISKQMPNLPQSASPVKHVQDNRRNNNNSYENKNRDGYVNAQQSSNSNDSSNEFSQMKTVDGSQGSYSNGGNRNGGARNRGGRNYGGRGNGYQGNYGGQYVQQQQQPSLQQQQYPVNYPVPPNQSMMIPPPGYVPPMPHFSRNPNPSEIIQGKQVLAPFIDKNYYPGTVLGVDENQGISLVQYVNIPIPCFVHTEYLQLCHV